MPCGDHAPRLPNEDLEEAAGHYSEESYDARRDKHHHYLTQYQLQQQLPQQGSTSSRTSSVSSCSTALLADTDHICLEAEASEEEGSSGGDRFESGAAPRVVIFTAAYYVCDGVSLTIRKLRGHLQSKGIASRVVSCGPAGWSEPDVFTVPSIPLPIINADDNFGYSLGLKLTERCKAQIKSFKPSVIHFTVPDFLALDALRWAKAEHIPVMGTWHSNYSDYLKFYHLNIIRLPVERYIRSFYVNMPIYVPTPFIRKRLLDSGFPTERVGIWGRGVDFNMFKPSNRSMAFRRERGIEDDEVVILWVGRLVKEKSPDIWAEVIRRLEREGLRFRALVVGSGSWEENMKKLPRTEHLGWLSGEALARVYASVDVFLFPSEVETFGNVTLEALASGVPCVASAGCSGHLVSHGINGFVVGKADVEEYYMLTRRLVVDKGLRERFAAKARGSIKELEHDRVMDMMVTNYEGVMHAYHQVGGDGCASRSNGWGDVWIAMIFHFFSFLLWLGTPLMKGYVAVASGVGACWRRPFWGGLPDRMLMGFARCFSCLIRRQQLQLPRVGGGRGGGEREGGRPVFRERVKMLAICVWLSAIVIVYHTYTSMDWKATVGGWGGEER
ncbi:hypothetical protein VYU27_000880 [Nannochloropsis oceanica]